MHCWCLFGVYHLSTEISKCFVVLWCFSCKYVNNINVNNILDLGVREKKWNTLETFHKHTLTKTHLKLILEYMPILLTIALYVESSVALLWCSLDILLVVYDSGNSTFAMPCISLHNIPISTLFLNLFLFLICTYFRLSVLQRNLCSKTFRCDVADIH